MSFVENVRCGFLSLRQMHHAKHSLLARQGIKIPNKHGPSPGNLCTAAPGGDPEFVLSGRYSPNLWTSPFEYGFRKRLRQLLISRAEPLYFLKDRLE